MLKLTDEEKQRTANSSFAIGGVSCSADSFVVTASLFLRINICADKPAHRKSANRYVQFVLFKISTARLASFNVNPTYSLVNTKNCS